MSSISADPKSARALAPNREAMRLHLEWLVEPVHHLRPDLSIEIAWGAPDRGANNAETFRLDQIPNAVNFAVAKNRSGANVYVGVTLKREDTPPKGRTRAEHAALATALAIDIDTDFSIVARALFDIAKPQIIVITGRVPATRTQLWIRIAPSDDLSLWEEVLKRLAEISGSDRAATGRNRLMRLGGSISYPSPAKVARGYQTELTTVIFKGSHEYDLQTLRDHLGTLAPTATATVDDLEAIGRVHDFDVPPNIVKLPPPEDEDEIDLLKEVLGYISADCAYSVWRDVVWALLWTKWGCAEDIAREWSKTASHRYEDNGFDQLVASYDPNKDGPTLGTVYHHAMEGGWCPPDNTKKAGTRTGTSTTAIQLLSPEEVKQRPNIPSRIHGLLPAQGVAAIFGEPGSGKSFLALDLAFAIANGTPIWFDRHVNSCPVIYLGLEGQGGIKKRIQAWEVHNGQAAPQDARFMLGNFDLRDAKNVDHLAQTVIAAVGSGTVVIVDTLNQSAPGADENSSVDMSVITKNAQRLAAKVEGLVILIHHSGKDRSKGMRGHSSLNAAMDAAIEVINTKGGRTFAVTKAKDDGDSASYDFELVSYTVDKDDLGLPITSCAVRHVIHLPTPQAKPLKGKNQTAAMATLRTALASHPQGLSHQDAVNAVAAALPAAGGRAKSRAKELVDALIAARHLHFSEGGFCRLRARNKSV